MEDQNKMHYYWLTDKNKESEYYSNEFMLCPKCRVNYHIQDLHLFNSETVTIKCNCGSFTKGLAQVIESSTFYLHKTFEKNNFLFGNKNCSKPIKLELSNHNCSHGNKSISYCHECSQYLCTRCFPSHKNHICYDENLLEEDYEIRSDGFIESLSINYKILINQIDLAINQLSKDKEEVEKSYQENIQKNQLLNEFILRLYHNYKLSGKSNFINYLNYYNYSYDSEFFKIREVLTCENVHAESIKFIDYCKNNYFITLPHQQNNKITFIRNVISQYQERYGENNNYVKKAPEYKDMGWDNYDMTYDDQAERIKPEITEIDPYEHNFDINIQKIKKDKYIPKYEASHSIQINEEYESYYQTKMKFFVLNDYTLAIVMSNGAHNILIFSLSTLQKIMSIPIKINYEDTESMKWSFDSSTSINFHSLSDGTILYYYGNFINRIFLDSSTTYKIDKNILEGDNIDYIVELSNKEILIGLDRQTIYFVQNSVPFLIKRKMNKDYRAFCEISDTYLLFSNKEEGSFLVNLNTNDQENEFPDLFFKTGIRLEKRKKVILNNISELYVFDTISLKIETKISLRYQLVTFCIESNNNEFGYFTNSKKQSMKINLTTLKYKKIDFCPEQINISSILPLPNNRLLIQTGKNVKIFQNFDNI